jgi:hypothetical protein
MKSIIKNNSSFFIVQKIFQKLEDEEQREMLKAMVQKNI